MQKARARMIFQAAVDAFAERGFERTTMDEIAARARVAKGTIYYHFRSKEDLFAFLVEHGTGLLRERVLSQAAAERSVAGRLRAVIHSQVAFFKEYRDFCIIILREAWGEDTRQRHFRRMLVRYVEEIREVVETGDPPGSLPPESSESVAWAVFGAASLSALHFTLSDPDFDAELLAERLEKVLLCSFLREDGLRGDGPLSGHP